MALDHAPAAPRTVLSAEMAPMQIGIVVGLLVLSLTLGALLPGIGPMPPMDPAPAPVSEQPSTSPSPTPAAPPAATPRPTPADSPTPRPTVEPTPDPTSVPTPLPTVATSPPPSPAGPPRCEYTDIPTAHDGYADWAITLLDTLYHLPASYAPGDLVDSSVAGLNGGYAIRDLVVADLRTMAADARAAGAPIRLVSGYRSHAVQQATFDYWVSVGGYDRALRTSARAGHSEHQLGTAIDVTGEGDAAPWEYADWAATPAGAWMAANAWRYGFVLSYPRGAFDLTCYDYEPWHYRYVGRALAAQIVDSGLTPRQVLWELQ